MSRLIRLSVILLVCQFNVTHSLTSSNGKSSSSLPLSEISPLPKTDSVPTTNHLISQNLCYASQITFAFCGSVFPTVKYTAMTLKSTLKTMQNVTEVEKLNFLPVLLNVLMPMYKDMGHYSAIMINADKAQPKTNENQTALTISLPLMVTILKDSALYSQSSNQVDQLIADLGKLVNVQINNLKLTPDHNSIAMTMDQFIAFNENERQIGVANNGVAAGLRGLAIGYENILKLQTTPIATYYIGQSVVWYNKLSAGFNRLNPYMQTLAGAMIKDGIPNISEEIFTMNVEQLNTLISDTIKPIAHVLKVLGNYFEGFYNLGTYAMQHC